MNSERPTHIADSIERGKAFQPQEREGVTRGRSEIVINRGNRDLILLRRGKPIQAARLSPNELVGARRRALLLTYLQPSKHPPTFQILMDGVIKRGFHPTKKSVRSDITWFRETIGFELVRIHRPRTGSVTEEGVLADILAGSSLGKIAKKANVPPLLVRNLVTSLQEKGLADASVGKNVRRSLVATPELRERIRALAHLSLSSIRSTLLKEDKISVSYQQVRKIRNSLSQDE